MHIDGEIMQKNSVKVNKKLASTFKCLEFFALNKEGTVEDVAAFIKKNYTTAMRIIRKLRNIDAIKLERLERTSAKGKEKRVYRIMVRGLFYFMVAARAIATSKFEEIAKAHRDKLLTFKKWEYFKGRSLEKMIRDRFFDNLRTWTLSTWTTFYLFSTIKGKPAYPKMHRDEGAAKATDIIVLGLGFMLTPPEHIRQVVGEQEWSELVKLFKATEEDYELRMFKEKTLFEFEKEHEEALKSLSKWKALTF